GGGGTGGLARESGGGLGGLGGRSACHSRGAGSVVARTARRDEPVPHHAGPTGGDARDGCSCVGSRAPAGGKRHSRRTRGAGAPRGERAFSACAAAKTSARWRTGALGQQHVEVRVKVTRFCPRGRGELLPSRAPVVVEQRY